MRISFFPLFLQVTGEGLAFGQPGANKQWAKADVVFEYRDFKTLIDGGSSFPLSSAEEAELRGRVEDDDCIEVFFIRDFTPQDLHGGGVTFGAGTASSQVISSDANARNGVDFTHLAHELGHVLGLRHPDAPATASAVPANTGTLMCPSGFNNDNPKVNSRETRTCSAIPCCSSLSSSEARDRTAPIARIAARVREVRIGKEVGNRTAGWDASPGRARAG